MPDRVESRRSDRSAIAGLVRRGAEGIIATVIHARAAARRAQ